MSDTSGPVEGQATSPAPSTEAAAPAHDPIADRMDQLSGTVGELVNGFQQWQQANAPAPEPEDPMAPWAPLFGAAEPDFGEPAAAPGLDAAALQSAFQQAIAQSNQPLLDRLQNFEVQQATQRLYEQIPQLKEVPESHPDYATHQAARQATHQAVKDSLSNYPSHIADALAADPNYIAMTFRAAEAQKIAAGQAPASDQVPGVESAGGAVPGGNGAPVNPVHQAYGANRHEMPSGFA